MNVQSSYLKEKQYNVINWMKQMVFFTFFLSVFCILINRVASPTLYLFVGISAVYLLMRRNIRIGGYVACLVGFLLYTMLACFWSPANDAYDAVVRIVIKFVLFAFCLYNVIETKEDCEKALRFLCIAGLCFSLFSAVYYGPSRLFTAIQTGERLGQEICGINTFGLYAGLTLALCLYLARIKGKVIYYAFVFLPLILVLASSSRKAFLLVFCAVVYFFAVKKLQKSFVKGLLIVGGILGALVLILQLPAFEQIWLRLQIFFETTVQGSTTADQSTEVRFKLIEVGMDFFRDRPLFGNGTNAFRNIASTYFIIDEISAHNNYVDILTNFGLIGFSFYYIPMLRLTWQSFKGVIRMIPIFYCVLFVLLVTFTLLDMSCISYHFIIPYAFNIVFARAVDLYRDELKEKVVQEEDEETFVEDSKYLK